ncbi:MAG: RNA 2',3'-cyclic phosphodiesterase [Planctomycetia bacterium]|nr:RNA 2',3'-cyclic phosphodiesterase [Planctomycetia bacterium]
MDNKVRTFIALEIAEKSRQQAFTLEQKLMETEADVRWEPASKFHITLKFLGEIPNPEVYEICRDVAAVAKRHHPFMFCLKGVGAFPNVEKPRSVWMGVDDEGRQAITELAADVDRVMQQRGFPRELKPYFPHMTLGRIQRISPKLGDLSARIRQYEAYDAGKTFVRHLTVFASKMARSGSNYTVLSTAELS